MESDARQLSPPKQRCFRADGFLHDRMGLACTTDAVARVFRWRASVNAWRRAGHDAKNARVCPGAFIAIMWGGIWVQRSAVRTRRRDADVHGHHGVIVRLRHVTPSRSARDRRSSSRITTRPFVLSLSKDGRPTPIPSMVRQAHHERYPGKRSHPPPYRQGRQRERCHRSSASAAPKPGSW